LSHDLHFAVLTRKSNVAFNIMPLPKADNLQMSSKRKQLKYIRLFK